MTDIVEKNRQDWEKYSEKYMAFNLSDSVLERLKSRPESAFAPAVWAMLKEYLPELKNQRVCVPSSGDNHAVLAFALMGARVTSCDISQNQLAAAKAAAEKLGLGDRAAFRQEDTMRLDGIEDEAYDLVYTSNGVHVWLNDLPSMYQNIHRILKPGGLYVMYELHPFQRPFGEGLKAVKPYDSTGPFEDETTVNFAWRIQDIVNAMLDAGVRLLHMEEIMPKPDYERPFFVKNEELINGRRPSREEVDEMYNWRKNPAAVLPEIITLAGRRAEQE
ncbi:MAG: class I SAM-dependent methyltransferase [Acutalibacter sp.]|nr:class I SAM-dependent methyltransferase [Acutalibacter sp.]